MKIICFSWHIILVVLIISISVTYSQTLNIANMNLDEKLVSNTNDSGPGSLREAIYAANHYLHLNRNIIRFNIPKSDPGYDSNKGIWVIKPDSSYEYIIDRNLIIDGFSQSAFIGTDENPLGPEIVIDGSNAGTQTTALTTTAEGTEIYGLTINRFDGSGIIFYPPGLGTVSGCYIGTDYSGMNAAGNNFGISIWNRVIGVHIGPSEYAYPNVISGNTHSGIFMADSASNNTIIGNFIGLNRGGMATILNNLRSISLERFCEHNEIMENMIGGSQEGILIIESNFNLIVNNLVGTNHSGELNFGNTGSGITLWNNSSENFINRNGIGYYNTGISVDGANSLRNKISMNLISHNNGLGIDNRNGGNLELMPPEITVVNNNEVSGVAGANQIIEIFADADDEGMIFINSTASNQSGNFTITISELPELPNITATATDGSGNTSEFSAPYIVTEVEENPIPQEFYLSQNFPNPFNPITTIKYSIPNVETSNTLSVRLLVYDVLGNEVNVLVNKEQAPGTYKTKLNSSELSSGVYFYKLNAKSLDGTKLFSAVKKLMVLK